MSKTQSSPFGINSLSKSERESNHSDIRIPNVWIRAKNALLGKNKLIETLNNNADIMFLFDFKDKAGAVMGDVLKITPRIAKDSSYNDKEEAIEYIKALVKHIGFEAYEPFLSDKDEGSIFISLRDKKNLSVIQKTGHKLNYNSSKPLKQEFINSIIENNLAR